MLLIRVVCGLWERGAVVYVILAHVILEAISANKVLVLSKF